MFDERIYIHVIGHIKITRTRRRAALFDERIYMHVIGHIKITRTRRRVALFDERIYMHVIGHINNNKNTEEEWHCLMKGFICMLLDILR